MSRVVLVSGGGTGIGRAVAAEFAASGDQVVILGRRKDVLDRAAEEIDAVAIPADLVEDTEVERVRAEVAGRFGRVDVLVNNAGGNTEFGATPSQGIRGLSERWLGNFRANVLSAVLPTEALSDLLADDGRVLFLSSIAAVRGSGTGSYGAVKAALHPYAFDLASALGPRGITVNVIAPGYIEDTEFFGDRLDEERRRALVDQTATGRPGTPRDVAATVHWLASPAAGHVTGQIIQVNGGAERGR
ncbi:3-oxoacyl-[acyl-carrier protein] reductase [Amycolatopsis arida]|uniref:3-oxoacyl-[acyl-carrier protein] reductase n=1 Tax=Amycolatopsis arida TaxID=587909 RepID=A0A1I5V2X3_9PSEU|nr:SDR family oxidoreductase [Amycolatopsis arida]TDX91130.1 3-oxoacyl-[acyl-carrier protein] reductase [Amycolatopsis arida]SFQ01904.1 3-oxoacyl-[acyl-carrier protein] reductase [Amycolatopsis arida]